MLSMAPVGSAGGAAKYFAADNYYTVEENSEESVWYGEGAKLLGLAPRDSDEPGGDGDAAPPLDDATEPTLDAGEGPGENEVANDGPADSALDAREDTGEHHTVADEPDGAEAAAAIAYEAQHDPALKPEAESAIGDTPFDPDEPRSASPASMSMSGTRSADRLPLSNPTGKVEAFSQMALRSVSPATDALAWT